MVKVACCQMSCGAEPDANVKRAEKLVRSAAAAGAGGSADQVGVDVLESATGAGAGVLAVSTG